jgi:hypothetical protein
MNGHRGHSVQRSGRGASTPERPRPAAAPWGALAALVVGVLLALLAALGDLQVLVEWFAPLAP